MVHARHQVARQADVEYGQSTAAVAVIDPVFARGTRSLCGRLIEPNGISCVLVPAAIVVGKSAW